MSLSKPEGNIPCKSCDSFFKEKKDLLLHDHLAHGKPLYKCSHCEEYFSYLCTLKRHEVRRTCLQNNNRRKRRICQEVDKSGEDVSPSNQQASIFKCTPCGKVFCRMDILQRHKQYHCNKRQRTNTHNEMEPIPSTSRDIYHTENVTTEKENFFPTANVSATDNSNIVNSTTTQDPRTDVNNELKKLFETQEVITVETAFKSRICTYKIQNKIKEHNPTNYLLSKSNVVKYLISKELKNKKCLKVNLRFEVEHENMKGEIQEKNFKTVNIPIYQETDLSSFIIRSFDKLQREMSEFQGKGSGWSVSQVNGLEVRINKFSPLKGNGYIELPKFIKGKNAVLNLQNDDKKCFQYAVLAKLCTTDNPHRIEQYKNMQTDYNFDCISAPTALNEIPTFERVNNMSINVFGIDDDAQKIYPIKVCDVELEDHRDILFVRDKSGNTHYCYITSFERLLSRQLSKANGSKCICKRCFTYYYKENNGEEKLKEHKRLCLKKEVTRIDMPTTDNYKIKFKNVEHSLTLPVVLYADFESILKKVSSCKPSPQQSSTTKVQEHELLSFCVYVKTHDLNKKELKYLPSEPYIYRKKSEDDDVGAHFIKYIQKIANIVKEIYAKHDPMNPLTDEEKNNFADSKHCYLCKKPFDCSNYKVRDHNHLTGAYRGAAHNICNLNNRKPRVLPIFFHGLSNYDSHFIIRNLSTIPGEVEIIPNTEEKYISFTKYIGNIKCRFLDSYRFMSCSLSKLADNLPREAFKETEKNSNISKEKMDLLLRKGVYCYDYTDCIDKMNITEMPSKEDFYSLLTESDISEEDYEHAKQVWKIFDIKNLGEYSDLYLKTDVLILADVFEHFRTLCLHTYSLDPCYYFTAPSLAWDAALKYTQVTLELLQDYDMLLMFEEGIRGGITTCVKRHAIANNPLLENYNPNKPTLYIVYLDANNLYGKSMSDYLPTGGFEWIHFTTSEELEKIADDGEYGYVFEVDVNYPETMHDKHSDLPFLPERLAPPDSKHKKLLTTLFSKEKYVAHYRFLKQAIKHGLEITKFHRGIKFNQSTWLASYIALNTVLRKAAKNAFELDFFKLMNNSVYGKTMEQVRNRMNMKIVVTPLQLQKLINQCNFLDRTIFAENVVAVHLAKKSVLMNKPIYVGQVILDVSKIVMYEFYYDVLKSYYGNKVQLLYGDTDSLIIYVESSDFYEDCLKMKHHFDFSDYPIDHKCFSLENKKELGKFKDETNAIPIFEFCGLRPKMYFIEFDGRVIKKVKGVKAYAVKTKIIKSDFLKCLESKKFKMVDYKNISSKKHLVSTVHCVKVALTAEDDKRIILECGIDTLPYGHKRFNVKESNETS